MPVQTPRDDAAFVAERNVPTKRYLQFFRDLAAAGSLAADQVAAINASLRTIALALGSPDGSVDNIPDLNFSSGLQELADSGQGVALFKITRDDYGRVEGTEQATAADLPYDNATSGLAADDTQAAIDELASLAGEQVFQRMDTDGDFRITADGNLRVTN
jgi:hypothetical protein